MNNILNTKNFDILAIKEEFKNNSPFPHVVIDNFLNPDIAEIIYASFPSHNEKFWHEYSNPLEKKLACNVFENIPADIASALIKFNSQEVRDLFSEITSIENLLPDEGLHGGGMHCIKRGGKLDVHVDYAIHPKLKLERRLNLILYLNKDWDLSWGGNLELWSKDMSTCIKKVAPIFNRAVIFDTGEGSYHGHPDPLECPETQSRKSLAVYYLTEPRPQTQERFRAQFVARPHDPKDEKMEEFRRLRADLNEGQKLHRVKE